MGSNFSGTERPRFLGAFPAGRYPDASGEAEFSQIYVNNVGFHSVINGEWVQDAFAVRPWEDLRFPAQGINPAGAINAPSVDTNLADFPGTFLFAGNQVNVISGVAQMPHDWFDGSSIYPHIHWSLPIGSALAVDWAFYWRIIGNANQTSGAWSAAIPGVFAAGTPTTANNQCITTFGSIPMVGLVKSAMIAWQIHRLGSTDPNNGLARLLEFDIHYQKNRAGSPEQY